MISPCFFIYQSQ